MRVFPKIDSFDHDVLRTCLTCSTEFKGRYCNQCGEKVIMPGEESVRVFFAEILNAFTFLDGKFIRSFRLMLFRPGAYSKAYAQGIRVPYMKPIAFFFVANFIFFLFPFITSNTLSTPLRYQHMISAYGAYVPGIIENKMAEEKIDREQLEERYNAQSASLSKLLIILLVFLFAFVLAIVNYKKSRYLAGHFYLSFEFFAFFLFINMIVLSIIVYDIFIVAHWIEVDMNQYITDTFFGRVFAVTGLYFLIHAFRIFYDQKWVFAIGKAVIVLFCLNFVFMVYKGMLFYLTMWTI